MWGRGPRGNNGTCSTLCQISVVPPPPTSKVGPSGADSWVGGLVYSLGPCGSLQRTLLWGCEFLPLLPPQPPRVFSISGLRLYFPALEPWVARSVATSTSFGLACPSPPATSLLQVLSAWLPISAPPMGLDECFFLNSLVVRLPYNLIFCQFWLFFVFKLLLSFFWLCKEAQCVYLCLHLGQKSVITVLLITYNHSSDWNVHCFHDRGTTTSAEAFLFSSLKINHPIWHYMVHRILFLWHLWFSSSILLGSVYLY